MKKILLLLLMSVAFSTLSACGKDEADTMIDIPDEGIIYAHNLPYYSYMNDNNPVVTITVKNIGVMELELFPNVAANTVNNFIKYIQEGSYSGNEFHRVISGFMIQAGSLTETACEIEGEFSDNGITNNLDHERGVLSTARTSVMNSASSQFFIMHNESAYLDGKYAAFGGLISGFNVLDYIATVDTNDSDSPLETIIIESITIDLKAYTPLEPICANQ